MPVATPFVAEIAKCPISNNPRRQPWVSVVQEPSPGRGETIPMGDKLFRLVFRPSGADSRICLSPRLTLWAIILRLSEPNANGASFR